MMMAMKMMVRMMVDMVGRIMITMPVLILWLVKIQSRTSMVSLKYQTVAIGVIVQNLLLHYIMLATI